MSHETGGSTPALPRGHHISVDTAPPPSIARSVQVVYALVALSLLNLALTIVFKDSLIESWAGSGEGLYSELLDEGGTQRIGELGVAPAFVPIAVISFILFGVIFLFLALMLQRGAGWARIVLTILSVLALLSVPIGFLQSRPILFTVISLLTAALYLVLLFFMWRRPSTDYIKAT